jgi:L-alanine-DL-glutamate epimerase-like enolase superfamily enzyme
MPPFMSKPTDIRVVGTRLHFIAVRTRVPLKFGPEVTTSVTVARACVRVVDRRGRHAEGWGETPLSVQWVWPGTLPYEARHATLKDFSVRLAGAWAGFGGRGHPMEVGADFQEAELGRLWRRFNRTPGQSRASEPMPWLAALVCCSPFDLATHDAFGKLLRRPVYSTYGPAFMNRDLAAHLKPEVGDGVSFRGKFPGDFLVRNPPRRLRAWHLVGGLDLLERTELTGAEPKDGYPVLLREWIRRDGLKCLKVKLRGNDSAWDYRRLEQVGSIAVQNKVDWLSADFNCTVTEPDYVNEMLDRLRDEHPRLHGMILYVEQPFPYELKTHRIDVHSVSARKPLFLDESAHDWRLVRLGRELGWTGVALKTCKTQTGALLSACWARTHGMTLMVQDLTNPMLAQISHVLLAAHTGTIMGVETNAMQFYPEASLPEAQVHRGLFTRRGGCVDWSSVRGSGFGYRLDEICRTLPPPAAQFGEW